MKEETASTNLLDGGIWFPPQGTELSKSIDSLHDFIFFGSGIFFTLIVGATLYFIIKYRRTEANQIAQKQVIHNVPLEIIWSIIPLFLMMICFWWGFKDFIKQMVPPADAMEIHVTGKQWLWQFDYPNEGITTVNDLHVPEHRPVKLLMTSGDVLHSLFIPTFRVKYDLLPNRYTTVWFEAIKKGTFDIYCTEFCGNAHSSMLAKVSVHSESDYQSWIEEQHAALSADIPLDQLGEKLYISKACITCHSIDGSVKTGPTWKGVFGTKEKLADGSEVTVDENYIRESIMDPKIKVVEGYQPVMPTYSGLLRDREVNALIEFIKKQ